MYKTYPLFGPFLMSNGKKRAMTPQTTDAVMIGMS
jgi:hypothetical protein